ncbi:MAG: hypothetical protein Q9217_003331 [Psora testacea]
MVSAAWLLEYRAIYGKPEEPFITGVGCYDGSPSWKPPSDPAERWDQNQPQNVQEIPVMRQRSSPGQHGFVLHDACWRLLKKACEPEPIPLGRLLMMCESLPFPLRTHGVCWGHDYGQLLVLDTQNYYPWQEQFHHLSGKIFGSCIWENPFEIPDLAGTISNLTIPPAGKKISARVRDCFYQLPWEIREIIATLLPTNDALKLRLACKSFLDLYFSAIFWSSRFKFDCERGFLFEVRGCRDIVKLLSLYRITAPSRRPLALRNRQRIWCLGRQLIKIARQSRRDEIGNPELQIVASKEWIRLAGDEQVEEPTSNWEPFERGCRPIDTIMVAVPDRLVRIGITTISLGALDYVTGIRLLAEGGHDACAGYQTDSDEILYPLRGLRGFKLAVGPGGIRALQVIDHNGCSSPWIGRAAGFPVSERLISSESLEALRVTVDGFKITSLAIPFEQASQLQVSKLSMPLRRAALWYPSVPSKELFLNEGSFTDQNPFRTGYRPLIWIHFGGQRGRYLEHIVGLSAEYLHRLHSLEFIYNDHLRKESVTGKLGCGDTDHLSSCPMFTIDGAAGERIEVIEVGIHQNKDDRAYDFLKYGILKSIKITTTQGRIFEVGKPCDSTYLRTLNVVEGTTITGLYTSHVGLGSGQTVAGKDANKNRILNSV